MSATQTDPRPAWQRVFSILCQKFVDALYVIRYPRLHRRRDAQRFVNPAEVIERVPERNLAVFACLTDGYLETELWQVMQLFGGVMSNGRELPFETTFVLEAAA